MKSFGRYGLWVSRMLWPRDAGEIADAAREIESLGYGSVWIGGSPPDDLALPAALLAATTGLVVGTSIVDVWRSDPAVLAAARNRLAAEFPGRFYLGLGSGHAPSAEATGQAYVRPLSRLREHLDAVAAPADEVMIAALGPKALELAASRTAGALPYLVPAAHTADARRILGPSRLLVPEQKVVLSEDPSVARAVGRAGIRMYLGLPNYTNNLRRYGLTDADFDGDGSDRWIDTTIVWGSAERIRDGVDAHVRAGADHVAVHVVQPPPESSLPRAQWRELAGILISA